MRVLKQELGIKETTQVIENAKALLFAEIIEGKVFVWFEEDTTKSANVKLVTTGQEFTENGDSYLNTVFNNDGHIYHIYYKIV
jgi:hypothetical protein